jgi:hypothetical protein
LALDDKPAWRDSLGEFAIRFVGTAAFPSLAYWLRWPTRLGPRGVLAHAAFNALLIFAVRTVSKRSIEMRERAKGELRK